MKIYRYLNMIDATKGMRVKFSKVLKPLHDQLTLIDFASVDVKS